MNKEDILERLEFLLSACKSQDINDVLLLTFRCLVEKTIKGIYNPCTDGRSCNGCEYIRELYNVRKFK